MNGVTLMGFLAQTGTGKTAPLVNPVIAQNAGKREARPEPRTVRGTGCWRPTRELAKQIMETSRLLRRAPS